MTTNTQPQTQQSGGDDHKVIDPKDVFVEPKEVPDPPKAIFGKHVYIREDLVEAREREARIAERDFAWHLINDIRYQNITLDFAKHLTLERLSDLQVDAQMAQPKPQAGEGGES